MRWMLYLGIGAVFLLGGVAGGMFGMYLQKERIRELEQRPTAFFMDMMSRKLEKELQLSPEQVAKIRAIYDEVRPELSKIESERRKTVGKIMESTHPKVRAVLTAEQNKMFDDMLERLKQRFSEGPWRGEKGSRPPGDWEKNRDHRDGPPGGPDGRPGRDGEGRDGGDRERHRPPPEGGSQEGAPVEEDPSEPTPAVE